MSDNNDNPVLSFAKQKLPKKVKKFTPEQTRREALARSFSNIMKLIVPLSIIITIYLYTRSIIKTILIGAVLYVIFMFAFMILMGYSLINQARDLQRKRGTLKN
jgi:hypothetical protein